MASIVLKVNGNDQTIDFPWFTESLDSLLGNSRPSTLQEIEKDQYWSNLFQQYCYAKGAGAQYDAWANSGFDNGDEREALKNVQVTSETKGTLDVRNAFRADLGWIKALLKQKQRQDEGLGDEINNTFDLDWPQ